MAEGPVAIRNTRTGGLVATRARVAGSFFARLKGLLGTDELAPGAGLLITRCNSVHGFGMRYAIDVGFLDAEGRLLMAIPAMRPNRVSPIVRHARYVLELPAGTLERTGTRVGDQLEWPV